MNQVIVTSPVQIHPISKSHKCEFCDTPTTRVIGIIDSRANLAQGSVMKYFGICETHLNAIDRIISKEVDINDFTRVDIDTPEGFNLRSLL